MRNRSFVAASWLRVGLAILPGLSALFISSGLPWSLFSMSVADALVKGGLIAVCIPLIIAGFILKRRIAVWSFPALGILLFPASGVLLFIGWWVRLPFVDEASPIWYDGPFILMILVLVGIGAFAVYRVCRQHRTHPPRLAWVLLGLIILVGVADVITSPMVDRNPNAWTALLAQLAFTVSWTGVILSPVAIGLLLARRDGLLAGLMVVAFEYVVVDVIGDPSYGVLIHKSNQTASIVLSCLPALFFLVISPIWVLRSLSARGRVSGLMVPAFITLISVAVIRGIVLWGTAAEYSVDAWLRHGLSSAQLLMPLALAAVLYRWIGRQGAGADSQVDRLALVKGSTTATANDTVCEPGHFAWTEHIVGNSLRSKYSPDRKGSSWKGACSMNREGRFLREWPVYLFLGSA